MSLPPTDSFGRGGGSDDASPFFRFRGVDSPTQSGLVHHLGAYLTSFYTKAGIGLEGTEVTSLWTPRVVRFNLYTWLD
jgi:hypothetical protein